MKKILISGLGVVVLLCICLIWLSKEEPYRTQHVYYRLKSDDAVTIELQMQDVGSRGYNRRIVKVSPGRIEEIVELIDTNNMDISLWKRVDEDVNELGLKEP